MAVKAEEEEEGEGDYYLFYIVYDKISRILSHYHVQLIKVFTCKIHQIKYLWEGVITYYRY